ncbi:hypothetical protein GJW-30_1_01659 [Variibacter gotjawalensis]|uniref:Uncharacterized protein n=1 Tax=Variibacter gotjawalensis TaxID=1333996 RepID=A0A0S3PT81_9BRAD|nr:hypothetical protein [Variibacter gotjawalensis]NIK49444.1 hypothetical protein [Variibacter gotjawalensis]RZS51296.1 hypothetical protein EV661_3774 [Variibacter gotjawalensis]BAT59129.1 hypothetical protein GJW-30_1_01659 [Variibacter gotjawalensis]
MCQVLEFRRPVAAVAVETHEYVDLDLLSAVDFALRDLADIARHITVPAAREQAEACREMLQAAFSAALSRV